MSATIDGARVASLLGDVPVITSEGRAFPVDTRYVPPDPLQRLEDQMTLAILAALREEDGSLLAFLPGQAEIARTQERLAARIPADVDLAPLYGQLHRPPSRIAPSLRRRPVAAKSYSRPRSPRRR